MYSPLDNVSEGIVFELSRWNVHLLVCPDRYCYYDSYRLDSGGQRSRSQQVIKVVRYARRLWGVEVHFL